MRKFTSFIIALAVGALGLTANAQDLGAGKCSTASGSYVSSLSKVTFYWGQSLMMSSTIYFVDPQVQTSTNMFGQEVTTEYIMLDLTIPGKDEPAKVMATLSSDLAPFAEGGTQSGTSLVVNCQSAVQDAGNPTGEYTLTVPEGVVKDAAGNTNAGFTYTNILCRAGSNNPLVVSPEQGQINPDDFKTFTVTFDGKFVKFTDETAIVVTLADGNTWAPFRQWTGADITINDAGNGFTVDFSDYEIEEGQLYTILMGGSRFVYEKDGDNYINEQLWSNYFAWSGLPEGEMLEGPGSMTSTSVPAAVFTWNYETITIADAELGVTAYWGYPEYGPEYGDVIEIPLSALTLTTVENPDGKTAEGEYNALKIELAEYLTECVGQTVTVVIPAGLVKNAAGLVNPEQDFEFRIIGLSDSPVSCDETYDDGVYELTWVNVGMFGYYTLNNAVAPEMYLLDSEGEKVATIKYSATPADGCFWTEASFIHGLPGYVYVSVNGFEIPSGEYTLMVPEGLFILTDEYYNTTLSQLFTAEVDVVGSAGVEMTTADKNGVVRVYNLQGVKVMETMDASDVNNLGAGLYIVNGKKVLIKK